MKLRANLPTRLRYDERVRPPENRRVRQLALAYMIERLVEDGHLASYAEAARRLGLSRARISQLLRLRYLPARTQELLIRGH